MIHVCSLGEMARHAANIRPSHLISLVPEVDQPETPPGIAPERHLRVTIDDIIEPVEGQILPGPEHAAQLLGFLGSWDRQSSLLLHCIAGISRSMAAAFIALNLHEAGRERELAQRLRRAAPHAQPNRRLVEVADQALARHGRMLDALEAMGPAELRPTGPLVSLSFEGKQQA